MKNFKLYAPDIKILAYALIICLMPFILQAYKSTGTEIQDSKGAPLRAVAANVPGLLTMEESAAVDLLGKISKSGVKYVRILASFSGDGAFSFQTAPGVYNKTMFEKLDRITAASGKTGLKLVIALGDGSKEYDAKKAYAVWAEGSNEDVFFKDRISENLFKKFIREIITRVNTVTKTVYSADSVIFAWDLCNAAASDNDPDGSVMYSWVSEMSGYVRNLDKGHLITVNLDKHNTDEELINNYDIAMLPSVDFVTYTNKGSGTITDVLAGYGMNAGRPMAMLIPAATADMTDLVKEFAAAGGSLVFLDGNESFLTGLSGAVKKMSEAPAAARPLDITDAVAALATDSAEIKISAPDKAQVKTAYGTAEPLKNKADGNGVIRLTGLKPGTKYFYRVKALKDNKGYISSLKSITTKTLVRLTTVPFKTSSNFIKAKDGAFWDGAKKYRYVGANNYYIRHLVGQNKKALVDEIFKEAAKVGIKVIRIGSNGEAENMESIDKNSVNRFFRIGPEYFNETAYKEFDYVLDSAARHGVRVIIHFTDNWEYYGGCKVYVKWAGMSNKNLFWTDEKVKTYYKQTIDSIVDRKNTVNGKLYKNDPAIFAYDLLNEPRNEDDNTGKVLAAWIDEMSAYVKSKDSNHMVTTGMEGFFLKSDGTHYSGSDFVLCQEPKNIDFCTFHIYPENPYNNFSPSTTQWMLSNFVKTGHERLKKPVVMEEYGLPSTNPDYPKAKWIKDMTEGFFKAGGDGSNYWFFIDPTYAFGDGNEINYTQTEYMNAIIPSANEANKGGY